MLLRPLHVHVTFAVVARENFQTNLLSEKGRGK